MNEQTIFLTALEIDDPADRRAYVEIACKGDANLHKQVESLLAAHERPGRFLDVPACEQVAGRTLPMTGSQDEETDSALLFLQPSTKPGSLGRLGHYEVLQMLGQGGFGVVVKAFDEKLHRMVAIKIMAPALAATSPARKRFLREARSSAAIRQENVVAIYAIEEQPLPFLVMEYIVGETLQQRLDRTGPLDTEETLRIGVQIANGLAAAHALGKIHRDIKPANILLEIGINRVKITDFGLARAADDASLTQSGVVAGTPMYMSPEQAQGAVIDHRADLFSLGSVLYVMCCGRPPFRASTAFAVLKRVAEDTPRPIRDIIPEVPQWLCDVIKRLHAKKPEERFASAQEAADALTRCLREQQLTKKAQPLEEAALPAAAERKVGITMASEPTPMPRANPRRYQWLAAAIFMAALVGFGLTEATGVTNVFQSTVVRLFSPEGTLIIQVDDPDVSIKIDGEELVITGAGSKEIRLKPGQYTVQASKDGKIVRQDLVMVAKNGREIVHISRESPLAAKIAANDRTAAEWVLSIGGTVVIDDGSEREIKKAQDLPADPWTLRKIDLRDNAHVDDSGLEHLAGAKGLRELILVATDITDIGIKQLAGLGRLEALHLIDTRVTDAGLKELSGLSRLDLLYIDRTRVTNAGMKELAGLEKLRSIALSHLPITGSGLKDLAGMKTLTGLNLGGTPLSDVDVEVLAGMKWIRELVLSTTQVTDAGVKKMAAELNLTKLVISNLKITDAAVEELAGMKSLRWLSLSNTQVTDAGLSHLHQLSNLTKLHLTLTPVTPEGIAALQKALPGCEIITE